LSDRLVVFTFLDHYLLESFGDPVEMVYFSLLYIGYSEIKHIQIICLASNTGLWPLVLSIDEPFDVLLCLYLNLLSHGSCQPFSFKPVERPYAIHVLLAFHVIVKLCLIIYPRLTQLGDILVALS